MPRASAAWSTHQLEEFVAKTLELTIVAEGVERPAQLAHLRRLGCPQGQGFWFARPMTAAAATEHLAAARPLAAL